MRNWTIWSEAHTSTLGHVDHQQPEKNFNLYSRKQVLPRQGVQHTVKPTNPKLILMQLKNVEFSSRDKNIASRICQSSIIGLELDYLI